MQKLKELIKLSNLSNFQFFRSNVEGHVNHQKLRNCCVAKKLQSRTFSVKFRVFRREFLRNHSVYWAQISRDNWNCYALSIFRVFILLAPSNSAIRFLLTRDSDVSHPLSNRVNTAFCSSVIWSRTRTLHNGHPSWFLLWRGLPGDECQMYLGAGGW